MRGYERMLYYQSTQDIVEKANDDRQYTQHPAFIHCLCLQCYKNTREA
jgi:hypothetical protein